MQCPLLGEFGEEHIFSIYETKETSLLKSEKASLQQQLNQFQHEVHGEGGGGGYWELWRFLGWVLSPPSCPAAGEEQGARGAAG